MHHIKILLVFLLSLLSYSIHAKQSENKDLFFCYGKIAPESIKGYNYVVLEAQQFSKDDITVFKKNNLNVIAYISLGEVNKYASFYDKIEKYTLGENKIWNSRVLDLSNKETNQILFEQVSLLVKQGFNGLFLDNVDNFSSYGPSFAQRNYLVRFIKKMKEEYKELILIQNSGVELLSETHTYVNSILIESLATDYNFNKATYRTRKKSDYKERKKNIEKICTKYNKELFIIEYSNSKRLNRKILKRLPKKWPLFIGNIDLQTSPIFR